MLAKTAPDLAHLELSGNDLDDEEDDEEEGDGTIYKALVDCLKSKTSLQYLGLEDNAISTPSAHKLAGALGPMASLTEINLGCCSLDVSPGGP